MSVSFFEFVENLKSYDTDKFLNELETALEKDPDVTDLQKQQWQSGKDSDGNILGLYTKTTEILSFGLKKAGTPYTLYDTGDFYKGTALNAIEKNDDLSFFFDSTGKNTPLLLEKIGPEIFGLQQKNIDEFVQIAQDTAIKILNKNLKLK